MMLSVSRYLQPISFLLLFSIYGCDRPASPPGYNLLKPEKKILEEDLSEVSGITYLPEDRKFLAIVDEKGTLYEMDSTGENIRDHLGKPFGEDKDYEDIVKVDTSIYVLVSNGSIVEIDTRGNAVIHKFDNHKKDDFESMYYDPSSRTLVIMCKECNHEKKSKARTAYRFDLANKQFIKGEYFSIKTKQVSDILKDGVAEFKPSAVAIHPIENKLFILASAGTLLIVAELKGKVVGVYRLNPVMYPQAEGIAFAPNGDMFITNEAKLGKAVLLKLPYNRKTP